jgi:hypothetical protein
VSRVCITTIQRLYAMLCGQELASELEEQSLFEQDDSFGRDPKQVNYTFRERLFTEIFPGRTEVPKTLIFAKDDSHAEEIVRLVRLEFGVGNAFSDDTTARLWDAQGQLIATLKGHTDKVNSPVFSPDGTHILTASDDTTAQLWDIQGHPRDILSGHIDAVLSAVFSPDGTRILTTSADGTIQQHLVRSEDRRRQAACLVSRGLTQEEIDRFEVPTPLKFDLDHRQCPPVYSWEQPTK